MLSLVSFVFHLGVRTSWFHLRPLNTTILQPVNPRIHLSATVPHFHHGPSSHWLRWAPSSIWLVSCPFQASGYTSALHPFGSNGLHIPCGFASTMVFLSPRLHLSPMSHLLQTCNEPLCLRPFGSALDSTSCGSTSIGIPLGLPGLILEASAWLLPPLVSLWAFLLMAWIWVSPWLLPPSFPLWVFLPVLIWVALWVLPLPTPWPLLPAPQQTLPPASPPKDLFFPPPFLRLVIKWLILRSTFPCSFIFLLLHVKKNEGEKIKTE